MYFFGTIQTLTWIFFDALSLSDFENDSNYNFIDVESIRDRLEVHTSENHDSLQMYAF